MDAVFPALIGLGLWFCFEAWQSGKTGDAPHPIAKITTALGVSSGGGGGGGGSAVDNVAGSAPYTGPTTTTIVDGVPVTLGAGVSVAGGGTNALHG